MAYTATLKTLSTWLTEVDQKVAILKEITQQQRDFAAAGSLNMDIVRRYFDVLVGANNFLISAAAVTGLANYMIVEKQSQMADPLAELVAVRTQIVATLDWLRTNVPEMTVGGQQYKAAFRFPTGNTTPSSALTFSAASTTTYRTVLDSLIATIS